MCKLLTKNAKYDLNRSYWRISYSTQILPRTSDRTLYQVLLVKTWKIHLCFYHLIKMASSLRMALGPTFLLLYSAQPTGLAFQLISFILTLHVLSIYLIKHHIYYIKGTNISLYLLERSIFFGFCRISRSFKKL